MPLFGRPRPSAVFTPGELPIGRDNVYVSRATSEASLRRGLERNQCPVVFGDYGVGKTSMVRYYFRSKESSSLVNRWFHGAPKNGRVVYFPSSSGLTLPKVFEGILEHLEYRVETEVTESLGSEIGAGFERKKLTATVKRSRGRQSVNKLVVTAPTDRGILRIIDHARLTVIIDELHLASEDFRADLVPFIKATRVSAKNSELVLIGTTSDAWAIVEADKGTDRFIVDTQVQTMGDDEATALVSNGFQKLGLAIPADLIASTVSVASGAPSILQSLCLDMAQNAIEHRRRIVNHDDLNSAVRHYIQDKDGRMARRYITAIETKGEKRYRKQILRAIANLDDEYATMDKIRAAVGEQLGGGAVPASTLSRPLNELRQEEYGAILQDVKRGSGDRIQNVTVFTDPMMKSYVRFMDTITSTNIVHEDEVREALADEDARH